MTAEGFYLGVDPGKLTGLCLVECTGVDVRLRWSGEADQRQVAEKIRPTLEWARWSQMDLTVVVERFIITAQTARNSSAPWSLETIGIVKQCAWDAAIPDNKIVLQTSSQGKIVTNPMLHSLGLWHRGGKGHANDALRHVVALLLKAGYRDDRLLSS